MIAPLFWDFETYAERNRSTVLFPLFWRFRRGSTVSQLAGNTYYHAWRQGDVSGWEFHFFPLFAYGESGAHDYWWKVLYGLAGYERRGEYARGQVMWVPFQMDGPDD